MVSLSYPIDKFKNLVSFKTGKLNSNAAKVNGVYPFFTCSQETFKTDTYSFDTECVLLGGNNAAGVYPLKYFSGKFDAYQRTYIIRSLNEEKLINRYLFYALRTKLEILKSISTGATTKFLTLTILNEIEINIPPLSTQQKIAGILSAYDDLIENNLKRINLLEELAQITYEEWFVRLRFPGHETTPINSETGLPEGWKSKNIGSLIEREIGGGWGSEKMDAEHSAPAYVIRGTDIYGLNNLSVKNIPFRFHKKSNLRSRKLNHGDIVFEVSGGSRTEGVAKTGFITTALLNQFGKNVMCASFCKLLHPIDCSIGLILFHYFRFLRKIKATEIFEIRGASSIINYNWKAFLKFQKTPFPSSKLIEKFHHNAIVIHDEVQNLSSQNQRLREARDILLPRLMTGMIDVDEYNPADLLKEAI